MNDIVLSDNEQVELEKLTKQAQRNATEAQKFSIEAAKILSVTKERLAEYKDRGFFKRCWYAVSGKTSALERANQEDLIKMQKFAWMYLSKLQEQNLIQAKAIAVIRNNLKEVQDEVGELSEQVSVIVDKFDARVRELEGVSAIQDWLQSLRVNESINRDPKFICFLQIVFDYLATIRAKHISFEKVNMRKDLDIAFNDFGLDRKEEITIGEFVSGLYKEVVAFGIERFKRLITIDIEGTTLQPSYMLECVSGKGYSALYGLANDLERAKEDDLRAGEVLVSNKQLDPEGDARYTFVALGKEIIGACLLTEMCYYDECKEATESANVEEICSVNEDLAPIGVEFKKLYSTPFLANEIEDVIAFNNRWYVIAKRCVWVSDDAQTWQEAVHSSEMLENLKVVNNILIGWSACKYYYTIDGLGWKSFGFSGRWGDMGNDFFYYAGNWFMCSISSTKTEFYKSATLDGNWIEISKNDFDGNDVVSSMSSYGSPLGAFVLTAPSLDSSLSSFGQYSGEKKLWETHDCVHWRRAVIEGSLNFDPHIYVLSDDIMFTQIGNAIVLTGCYATYCSVDGKSWRRVLNIKIKSGLTKIGKFYCGFRAANRFSTSEEWEMYLTCNGFEFEKIKISQRPSKAIFKGSNVLLVDINEESGGVFLGSLIYS